MAAEQISLTQVMMLVVISRLSLTLVYFGMPDVVGHDVWWQSFPAAMVGILYLWMLNHLWQRFPGLTLFQVFERVLGKVVGKLLTLLYWFFFLLMLSLNLRLVGEFFVYAFLPQTPIIIIISVITALAVWACRDGIEVIARAGEVVFPLLIGSIVLIIGLLLKDIDLQFLMPLKILHTGPLPHLKDMVSVASRTVEIAWLGILVPHVVDPKGIWKAGVKAQLWQGVIWVMMNLTMIGVLGREVEPHYFPFFAAARLVNVADFLERIDSLFLAIWLFGMFLRCSVLLWSAAKGAAQFAGLQEYRPLVIPLAGIAVTYSLAQAESFSSLLKFLSPESFTPFTLLFVTILPMLVWLVAVVRRLRQPPPWRPPID